MTAPAQQNHPVGLLSLQSRLCSTPLPPPTLISLAQLQSQPPPVVSTGLRLAFEDQKQQYQNQNQNQSNLFLSPPSSCSSSFSSILSEEITAQINQRKDEIEQFLHAQGEQLRRAWQRGGRDTTELCWAWQRRWPLGGYERRRQRWSGPNREALKCLTKSSLFGLPSRPNRELRPLPAHRRLRRGREEGREGGRGEGGRRRSTEGDGDEEGSRRWRRGLTAGARKDNCRGRRCLPIPGKEVAGEAAYRCRYRGRRRERKEKRKERRAVR